MITGKYPTLRLRRSRKYAWSRKLVQESSLSYSDLILPIFLIEGKNKKESIKSMPNVFRYSVDKLNIAVGKAIKKGIPSPVLSSNLAYYDLVFSNHKIGETIQLQRSFFGLHPLKNKKNSKKIWYPFVCLFI